MIRRALAPSLIILVLLVIASAPSIRAQDIHHYVATVSGMSTTLQEKRIMETLSEFDPLAEYRVDRATGEVVIKTRYTLDRFRFERMIDRLNLGVLQFDVVGAPVTPVGSGLRQPRLADMPLFMDTGDPVLDQQRYAAYKAAWIAAHPDQYRELTAPQGATTNPDPE